MNIEIKVPYTTKPSMKRRQGPAFASPADEAKIQSKHRELQMHGCQLWAQTKGNEIQNIIAQAATHCGKPTTNSIVDLALCFQEDFAIMDHGTLVAVCFCFPSGWVPADRLGQTLTQIHQPVADNADLVRMSARLAQTMADPVIGRFQRQVWTVTACSDLSMLPGRSNWPEPESINDLFFRWENQTTEPLGNGSTSLFFVDVNVVPLSTVWAALGSHIVNSINSMTESVLTYKNLHKVKEILNKVM